MIFSWYLQGGSDTEIAASDILQFAGLAGFSSRITVEEYNDTTHVKTSVGANKSSANTPKNNKFISQAGGAGAKSQVDVGAGTVNLDTVAEGSAVLKINLSDVGSFEVESAVFYTYDGVTAATQPVGLDIRAGEVTNANFTQAEGSGSPLLLIDKTTPAMSQDYFIVLSVSPISAGLLPMTMRIEGVAF